jgi:dihydroxyacid dehydratase/phosphogluconate dehydratase
MQMINCERTWWSRLNVCCACECHLPGGVLYVMLSLHVPAVACAAGPFQYGLRAGRDHEGRRHAV